MKTNFDIEKFIESGSINNELDLERAMIADRKLRLLSKDSLHFKIPSLRNLSYSYPYMHDGRFKTLREVLNHYTEQKIPLTSNEKTDIIAFLLTLNDVDFVFGN